MTQQPAALLTSQTSNNPHTGWRLQKSGAVIRVRTGEPRPMQTRATGNPETMRTITKESFRVAPGVVVPARNANRARFIPLARWEGTVLERFGSYFSSEVVRLEGDDAAYVEFEIGDVSEADRPLCEPGALFYWSIGYEVRPQGQRSRSSLLTFRRIPLGYT